jgi:hypothetical protein
MLVLWVHTMYNIQQNKILLWIIEQHIYSHAGSKRSFTRIALQQSGKVIGLNAIELKCNTKFNVRCSLCHVMAHMHAFDLSPLVITPPLQLGSIYVANIFLTTTTTKPFSPK